MAGQTGLEPATLGVTGRYSNQLSYYPAPFSRIPKIPDSTTEVNGNVLEIRIFRIPVRGRN